MLSYTKELGDPYCVLFIDFVKGERPKKFPNLTIKVSCVLYVVSEFCQMLSSSYNMYFPLVLMPFLPSVIATRVLHGLISWYVCDNKKALQLHPFILLPSNINLLFLLDSMMFTLTSVGKNVILQSIRDRIWKAQKHGVIVYKCSGYLIPASQLSAKQTESEIKFSLVNLQVYRQIPFVSWLFIITILNLLQIFFLAC